MIVLDTDSPVYKIFHYPFVVRVPNYAMMTDEMLESYGVGEEFKNTEDGERWAQQTRSIIMTINDMVELHREGVRLELVNVDDAARIYEIIMGHLGMWAYYAENTHTRLNPPIEDLTALDEMARAICSMANITFDREQDEEIMNSPLVALGLVTMERGSHAQHNSPIEAIVDKTHMVMSRNEY